MDVDPLGRPLFEEPTTDLERPDPWSGSKGFMLGGMALPTLGDMSEQYFDAAGVLLDAVRRNEVEDYRLANPALFLYRHSLELQLKSALGAAPPRHDLVPLARDFDLLMRARNGTGRLPHGHAGPAQGNRPFSWR